MNQITALNQAAKALKQGFVGKCGEPLARLLRQADIPARAGKKIHLSPDDCDRLQNLVEQMNKASRRTIDEIGDKPIPIDSSRGFLSLRISNEKMTRTRVREPRVAFRLQTGQALEGTAGKLTLPGNTWASMLPSELASYEIEGVITVENWESFERFDRLSFDIPACYRTFIIVYRGDPTIPESACQEFLRACKPRVVVFPDFDPAGLGLALSVPGFMDILWPGAEGLEEAFETMPSSSEKYLRQVSQWCWMLDSCEHRTVAKAWKIVKAHGRGLAQEIFTA